MGVQLNTWKPVDQATAEKTTDRPMAGSAGKEGDHGAESKGKMTVNVRTLALVVIAGVCAIFILEHAESVLIPIVLGILVSYMLAPIVSSLARYRVPRWVGGAVAVALLVSGMGVAAYTLSDEARSIVASVPEAAKRLRERVVAHRNYRGGALQQVQQAAKEIETTADVATKPEEDARSARLGRGPVQRVEIVAPAFRASDYLLMGGVGLVGFLGQFSVILFLVYFLLVSGDLYKRKLVALAGPELSQKKVAIRILDDINVQIESFIKVTLLTSLVVGLATGIALWLFGVENYVAWGLLAGFFNSVPYLGPIVVTGGLGIVALMQFDDALKAIYICASVMAITSLEGYLLTPALMSRAARMNAVAIFIGLLFWTWIWGVWGAVLAVPMMMMLKAVCDHIENLKPIGALLGE
jgi:predicted PurR-regulated permease PerM